MGTRRRQVEEWGELIQKQGEVNKQREQEEHVAVQQNKLNYRSNLDYLSSQLNHQKQSDQQREFQNDQQRVKQMEEMYRQDVQKEREDKTKIQNDLSQVYQQHTSHKSSVQQAEQQQKTIEEQQHLNMVRRQMDDDAAREQVRRNEFNRQQNEMLNYQEQKRNHEKQAHMEELQRDQKRVEEYKRNEEQKERNYRDFYSRVNDSHASKCNQFAQAAMMPENAKSANLNSWIRQNEEDYNRRQSEKEEMERQIRYSNLQNTKDTLLQQMQEKEMQKQRERQQHQREVEETSARIKYNQEVEEQQRRERAQVQKSYANTLLNQAQIREKQEHDTLFLNDKERMYHMPVIKQLDPSKVQPPIPAPRSGNLNRSLDNPSTNAAYGKHAAAPFGNMNQQRTPNQGAAPFATLGAGADSRGNFERNAVSPLPSAGPPGQGLTPQNFTSNQAQIPNAGRNPALIDHAAGAALRHSGSGSHNPITNPVGSGVPLPGSRPLFRGHRLNASYGF